jgi:Tol biopolymer transport system component
LWVISTLAGEVHKLVDDSVQGAYSPDGSYIGFWKDEKYWLMGPNGESPRPLMDLEKRFQFRGPKWSPDSRRIVYLRNKFGTSESSIEARSISDGATTVLLAAMGLLDFWWTPDGRLIYSQAAASAESTFDLWELGIDSKTLRPIGEPRRLTRWIGHSPGFVSISADGKRIVTTAGYTQSDVYLAELDTSGRTMKPETRLTLDARSDWPGGWTNGGKEILFFSDRNGSFNIFKQAASSPDPQLLIGGKENARAPQISPDGQWLLYMAWPDRQHSAPVRIMRAPQPGGPGEAVFEAHGAFASGVTFSATGEQDPEMREARGFPDFHCPTSAASSCIVAEADNDSVAFTQFDPIRGRGNEVARLQASPSKFFWDLSPDGLRVAYGEYGSRSDEHVTILNLNDHTTRDVSLGPWTNLSSVSWSAAGRHLFITTSKREGSDLLHVDLEGKVDVLRQLTGRWFGTSRQSPDEHLLAFGLRTLDSNVWLIETK